MPADIDWLSSDAQLLTMLPQKEHAVPSNEQAATPAKSLKLSKSASHALPPETLRGKTGWMAALSDNGASRGASCIKHMTGALPGTTQSDDTSIGVGTTDSDLCSVSRLTRPRHAQ